ncbi:MAG: ABC transporter permease [Methylotenera sp.]|nr:ABC transporter permease [Methylotenera sp.]MDO9232145.1 ABC transporter permease [Methylotenera sp.]MDO9388698.1 ABC transporter permease [Methylotenera sp.]MDP2101105.1 ABC transporter permease [Methylotenera sp.]MDP2280335.1 ABC transporter permease [Methylotenera sp.]
MLLADATRFALQAITSHRMRSFLTLLGIAVGIAAVILLTSIGEGVHRFVLAEFTQFGTNVIGVAPGKVKTGGQPPTGIPTTARLLTMEDAQALKQLPQVTGSTPTVWGNSEVEGNGRLRRTTIYGVDADFTRVFSSKVRIGSFLPREGAGSSRAFVVLGSKLRNELFGTTNPLGARVRIGGLHFRVIGVMAPKGQFLGIDLDDTAFIPAQRALELYNREGLMEIHVMYAEGASSATVAKAVKKQLTLRHGHEDFTVTTQEDMLKTLSNILNILTMAVGALGGISLLVGAVGIVTIMTISVTERTNEIGLLVALGARRSTVLGLFLSESIILAALGGVLGLLLGVGLAQLISLLIPTFPVHTPWSFAVGALLMSAVIGLLAGVLPARSAAHLDPIEALRAE